MHSLLLVLLLAQPQPPPHRTEGPLSGGKDQAQATQVKSDAKDGQGATPKPFAVAIQKTKDETAQEQQARDEQASLSRWTKALGGLSILLALGSLIVYVIQANRLKQTITTMDKIAKDQTRDMQAAIAQSARAAAAMEVSSKAARDTVMIASQQAHAAANQTAILMTQLEIQRAAERAWVMLDGLYLSQFKPGATPVARIKLKNCGKNPAFILEAKITIDIRGQDEALAATPEYPGPSAHDFGSAVLTPDQIATVAIKFDGDVAPADFAGVKDQTRTMYVYGFVEYRDTICGDESHRTNWIRRFDVHGSDETQKQVFALVPVKAYNQAT